MKFVVEQNAEPQAILLSLVTKDKMREANDANVFPHLRPKFVVKLLELVQEKYGPDSVDEAEGRVTESTKDMVTAEFNSFCSKDNRWVWFPCPRPIVMFWDDFLCLKFVIYFEGRNLDPEREAEESPAKKPKSDNEKNKKPKSRKEVIERMIEHFFVFLKEKGHELCKAGFRAWNLTGRSIESEEASCFVAIATSLICVENDIRTLLSNFSVWLLDNHQEFFHCFKLMKYDDKSSWVHFIKRDSEDEGGEDNKEFLEIMWTKQEEGLQVKEYKWNDDIDPTGFNSALQFLSYCPKDCSKD